MCVCICYILTFSRTGESIPLTKADCYHCQPQLTLGKFQRSLALPPSL